MFKMYIVFYIRSTKMWLIVVFQILLTVSVAWAVAR